MDKILNITTEGIQTDNKDNYHCHRYEPTPYTVIEQIFSEHPISHQDTLVDYGCGKGRLNFYLTHHFHCNTVGIEFMEEHYLYALKNLNSYRGNKKEKIQFFCLAAQDYEVKENENFFFFFNPFSVEIFKKVIRQIQISLEKQHRNVTIILYYPEFEYADYLHHRTQFRCTKEVPVNDLFHKDRRERIMFYTN